MHNLRNIQKNSFAGQIARLGNRVVMTARNEADNSEEPSFVQRVNNAANQLHSGEAVHGN